MGETFCLWKFKPVYYIGRNELTSRWKEIIIDDEVKCVEFSIIYQKFYFVI